MAKPKYLYHGSKSKLMGNKLLTRKAKDLSDSKVNSQKAVYLIMKGIMEHKKNILLQEQRAPSIKKHLKKCVKKHGYKILSFYLECSTATAKKRDLIHQKRHIRPEIVEEMHKKYAYPDKEDIIINTEKYSIKEVIS